MTKALCWQCGEFKFGAFTECLSCNAEPVKDEDLMISLLLTDHELSEDELLSYQERIRRGVKFQISEEIRQALLPAVEVAKRIMINENISSSELQYPSALGENSSHSIIQKLHRFIASSPLIAIVLFHMWRSSLILVFILSIMSALQGRLITLLNPIAFGAVTIGVGYSFASIILGSPALDQRLRQSRPYLVSACGAIIAFYFINPTPWLIPFAKLNISAFFLSLWAILMGIASSMRGDFDSAAKVRN